MNFKDLGLFPGKSLTRKEIRIKLGKKVAPSKILEVFDFLEKSGKIVLVSRSAMSDNTDTFKIT